MCHWFICLPDENRKRVSAWGVWILLGGPLVIVNHRGAVAHGEGVVPEASAVTGRRNPVNGPDENTSLGSWTV